MSKHWIKRAIHHVGGLHKSLGVPQGQKIPLHMLHAAAKQKGLLGKQARLALTLEGMPHPHEEQAAAQAEPAPAPTTTTTTHGGGLTIASRA